MIANRIVLLPFLTLFSFVLAAQQAAVPPAPASSVPTQTDTPGQAAASTSEQSPGVDHILQDGTPVQLALLEQISSSNAEVGQLIQFAIVNDLAVDGVTVLHRGALVTGVVSEAQKKKRMGRAGVLNFTISQVKLADGVNVPVRAFNNTNGDSHTVGVTALALNMPLVAAPFFLLMHGENSTIPKGTEITVFISGDIRLRLSDFNVPTASAARKNQTEGLPANAVQK